MIKVTKIQQLTFAQFERQFPDDDACRAYVRDQRWPDGVVVCPRCASVKVWELTARPFHWICKDCDPNGYRFSVLVGTIFENTNKGLREWFRVIHMLLSSKKGMSALQIQRMLGFGSYRTAWSMCHKIRTALMDGEFRKLMGIVEVDETFVGGKLHNKHRNKRGGGGGAGGSAGGPSGTLGNPAKGKAIVAGAVERRGNVVARVVSDVRANTLVNFVRESVSDKVSLICTDAWVGYKPVSREFPHGVVDHQAREYVVGAIHTNTIEGFWSQLKRAIIGTHHKVSAKYLPLYVAETQFKYNNRQNAAIFQTAVAAC